MPQSPLWYTDTVQRLCPLQSLKRTTVALPVCTQTLVDVYRQCIVGYGTLLSPLSLSVTTTSHLLPPPHPYLPGLQRQLVKRVDQKYLDTQCAVEKERKQTDFWSTTSPLCIALSLSFLTASPLCIALYLSLLTPSPLCIALFLSLRTASPLYIALSLSLLTAGRHRPGRNDHHLRQRAVRGLHEALPDPGNHHPVPEAHPQTSGPLLLPLTSVR